MAVLVRAHLRAGRAVRASIRRLPGHEYASSSGSGKWYIERTGARPWTLAMTRRVEQSTQRSWRGRKADVVRGGRAPDRVTVYSASGWNSPYVGGTTRRHAWVTPSSRARIQRLASGLR